jgi:hypothetical protein
MSCKNPFLLKASSAAKRKCTADLCLNLSLSPAMRGMEDASSPYLFILLDREISVLLYFSMLATAFV